MSRFHGILVLSIEDGGNRLVGNYTNTDSLSQDGYMLRPEAAHKQVPDRLGIGGRYNAISTNEDCILDITQHGGAYHFSWTGRDGAIRYTGLGKMAGTEYIAVSYIKEY